MSIADLLYPVDDLVVQPVPPGDPKSDGMVTPWQRTQTGGRVTSTAHTFDGVRPLEPRLRQLLARAQVARLATILPDGRPHIVPITFALDGDAIVTAVDHKPKTTANLQRLKNIEAHPVASVIVDHYEDDWSRLWWIRGDGEARITFEGGDHADAIGLLADKYEPYRNRPPRGPVIAVAITRWTSWSSEELRP